MIGKVILIGGPPLTGKSSVARALAAHIGHGSLSTDDLGQAIAAVTTAQSHPAFHLMDGLDYQEYYAPRSVEALIADAERCHAALWPAIAQVVKSHAAWGDPVVIEGWALYPARLAGLNLPNVGSLWLVAEESMLEARLRAAPDFYRGASDEEVMIQHFLARSLWHNERIRAEATAFGLPVVKVTMPTTVEELSARCLLVLEERMT